MNYHQAEEVIEILGSSDEDDFKANQSQSVLSPLKSGMEEKFSHVDDLLRDSPSPTFEKLKHGGSDGEAAYDNIFDLVK